jgi:hypothetical protein
MTDLVGCSLFKPDIPDRAITPLLYGDHTRAVVADTAPTNAADDQEPEPKTRLPFRCHPLP